MPPIDAKSIMHRLDRMERRLHLVDRQLRKQPVRIPPGGGGTNVRFVGATESTWLGKLPSITGPLYNARLELVSDEVTIVPLVHGFIAKGGNYPAIQREGDIWQIIGGGIWVARVTLQADLPQGGSADALLEVSDTVGDTITVYDNWGGAADGDVALEDEEIGVAWNHEAEQWEVWINNCHDELVEEEA